MEIKKDINISYFLQYLSCPNNQCGGEMESTEEGIVCRKCAKTYPLMNGNIVSFENYHASSNIFEKTMYGPEYHELESYSKKGKPKSQVLMGGYCFPHNTIALDYGCGSSNQVFELATIFDDGLIFGLDSDYIPLEIASKFARKNNYKNIFFIQYSKSNLPFRNGSFDFVVSHQVLEHVEEPEKVVEKITRIMKKGGVFEVDFPNGDSIGEILRNYFHLLIKKQNPHISRINYVRSKKMFADAKLEEIDFQSGQALTGPILYFMEGFVYRFILRRNKLWNVRRKIQESNIFRMLKIMEKRITKVAPKAGHAFRVVLKKN